MRRKLIHLAAGTWLTKSGRCRDVWFHRSEDGLGPMPLRRGSKFQRVSSVPRPRPFRNHDPKSGDVVPPGHPGELVFTPLDARGSVVLRYRTGDYIDGGLVYDPCPHCGRRAPQLVGNISRSSEIKEMRLDKVKGRWLISISWSTCWMTLKTSGPGSWSCANATTTLGKWTN